MDMKEREKVLVLDFGGQYNQLIARRVRDLNVYCDLKNCDMTMEEIKEYNPIGIIFTGGPNSVYEESSPHVSPDIFKLGIPVLGICYGCQLIAYTLGGYACGNQRVRQERNPRAEREPAFQGSA